MGFGRDFFGAATAALPQGVKLGVQGIEYAREKEKDVRAAQTATQASEQKTLAAIFKINSEVKDEIEASNQIAAIVETLPAGDFKDGVATFIPLNQEDRTKLANWRKTAQLSLSDHDNQQAVLEGGVNYEVHNIVLDMKDFYRPKGRLTKPAIAQRIFNLSVEAGKPDIETQNILIRSKHDAQMIFNEAKANKERALIEKTKKLIANAKEGESEGLKVLLTSYISHLASTLKSMEVPQAQITEEINYFTTGQRKGTSEFEETLKFLGEDTPEIRKIIAKVKEKEKHQKPITLSRKLSDVLYGKFGFRDISKATNTQIEEARLVVKQDEIDIASAKSANRLTQSAQYKATLPMFLEYKGTALIALSKLLDTISTGSKHDYSELKKKSLEELSKIKEGYGKETGFWTNKPGITHVEAQAIQTIVKEIKSYNKKIEVWESKKNKDAKKSPGKIKDPLTAVGYIGTLNNNKE